MSAPEPYPGVTGHMTCTAEEFKQRCLHYLALEQEKIAPDFALVDLLCNGVRLARRNSPKEFDREYLGKLAEESEKNRQLRELADAYHHDTEAYDRRVCTGPVVNGGVIPNTPPERAAISRHAIRVFDRLGALAADLGFSRKDWQKAVAEAANKTYKPNRPDHE